MSIPYESVDTYPEHTSGTAIITRMLDGLGYRFRYATEGLTPADYRYSPGKGCKTIGEIVKHVWGLVHWVYKSIHHKEAVCPDDSEEQRKHTLALVTILRTDFTETAEADLEKLKIGNYPFWHMVNGPISDALTHTGQINTLRRLAGNPPVQSDVFRLKKP